MELREIILSTLSELEDGNREIHPSNTVENNETIAQENDEIRFLEGMRERLLVLFEGFQSPNNTQIEAKVDLTLNFLEYLLSSIENRLGTIR